ncbi:MULTISPECIES: 4-(cytidine 5'-diphospho)-2-C-methyl-D-erythritol kinase [Rheinheimera]|uniref:4-diphosphocytidyl-2-C-methyl-D-erythritol kinase n=1 Tax=Rheinheimera marina TaxID=1774958 RepID=A0ABV9JNH8_9GAMM
MATLILPAPAKLNLFLHITGRRADGYHNLQTLFQLLDQGDQLQFTPRDDGQIQLRCNLPELETPDNLVLRAAALLKHKAAASAGVDIYLEKQVPMGGGLGGGSSDAATTLAALNQLWGLGLSIKELAELGLTLGADVPVFVEGQTAYAEGVGEHLQPVSLPEKYYLIVTPEVHVSTALVFQHPDLTRDTAPLTLAQLLNSDWKNDCEALVKQLYPEVALVLDWLIEYAPSRMTGTGASVFAEFPDEFSARQTLHKLPSQWRAFVAKGVAQSPLWTELKDAV